MAGRCKVHHGAHEYTRCGVCDCEYCPHSWEACPRGSWHPAHGSTDEEVGRRYRAMEASRRESERRTAALEFERRRVVGRTAGGVEIAFIGRRSGGDQ